MITGDVMGIIKIRNLTKKFGTLTAVNKISLDIEEGEIFGLLGPNGAGKTTTISMLATILKPTGGQATVVGHDIVKEMDGVRRNIGIVFQDPSLDDELTARENMDFHGRLYDMSKQERDERTVELLKLVELEDRADDLVGTFSGGMKRRLEIARGLMHLPKVLFLDEPTIGLDPQTRRKLWDYIKAFNRKEKVTIILTTHYMEEADVLCDRIGIIDHGKIIALDHSEKLKDVLGGDIVTIRVDNSKAMKDLLEKTDYIREIKVFDESINLVTHNGSKAIPKIIQLAQENGITVESATLKRPSLEDVFIHYTGRVIRPEDSDSGKEHMRMRMRMRWR